MATAVIFSLYPKPDAPSCEMKEEITLMEMDTNSETDSYVMDKTYIDEFVQDEGDRMLFMFDILSERSFFIELKEVLPGELDKPRCTLAQGTAPKQLTAEDEFLTNPTSSVGFSGEDFYGDEDFDMDELDAEGFMDMGPEDLY